MRSSIILGAIYMSTDNESSSINEVYWLLDRLLEDLGNQKKEVELAVTNFSI